MVRQNSCRPNATVANHTGIISGGKQTYRACHKLIAAAVGWRTTYAYGKASVKRLHLQLIAIFCTRSLLGLVRTVSQQPARALRPKRPISKAEKHDLEHPGTCRKPGHAKTCADHCVLIGWLYYSFSRSSGPGSPSRHCNTMNHWHRYNDARLLALRFLLTCSF